MIELVASSPEYAELWLQWRSEPSTLRYNPLSPLALEDLRQRMTEMRSNLADLKCANEFHFFIRSSEQLVGTATLKNISHMMMSGEIGYGLGQDFQGQGIGTIAVQQFVDKIFAETQLRRLYAYVAADNWPSRRLLERIGFHLEGVCRQHFVIQGRPTDEVLYGLLRSDERSPAPHLLAVHHAQVSIPKGNEAQAREFYCNVLGLEEIEKPLALRANGGFWLQLGPLQIHFGAEDGVDRHKTKSHLAYLVTDLNYWRETLQAREIVVVEGAALPGYVRFEFRDPFGNRVEFLQRST
jgi:RimJ/RimL family protein N-acetyltransferase/catechol 2,3-dioxygenase-like lactoylglutathione lyase family enzyme